MIISSYEVQSSSQSSYTKVESHISTTGWVKESDLAAAGLAGQAAAEADTVELSQAALAAQGNNGQAAKSKANENASDKAKENANGKPFQQSQEEGAVKLYKPTETQWGAPFATNPLDLKIKLLEAMLYALTGKRLSASFWGGQSYSSSSNFSFSQILGSQSSGGSRPEPMRQVTQTQHFLYESESVSYQAQGQIQTADGKSISVDVNMHMSREFVSYSSTSTVWAKPKDPLVINYAGTAASLTEQTYSFDLTMDGNMEQMNFVGPGSGFLAVDWNNDGSINDGGELFGARTGDGFGELSAYDQDGNGWIDEADDIFSKLQVWSKDENGNDQIFSLKELDVGAIYLGNVSTQFSYTDSANNTQGMLRSTSFFLKEDGSAGTVQHIDLMV